MLLIGGFLLCVAGWAVFGAMSNGDRKRVPFPFPRQPEPNYMKAWRNAHPLAANGSSRRSASPASWA